MGVFCKVLCVVMIFAAHFILIWANQTDPANSENDDETNQIIEKLASYLNKGIMKKRYMKEYIVLGLFYGNNNEVRAFWNGASRENGRFESNKDFSRVLYIVLDEKAKTEEKALYKLFNETNYAIKAEIDDCLFREMKATTPSRSITQYTSRTSSSTSTTAAAVTTTTTITATLEVPFADATTSNRNDIRNNSGSLDKQIQIKYTIALIKTGVIVDFSAWCKSGAVVHPRDENKKLANILFWTCIFFVFVIFLTTPWIFFYRRLRIVRSKIIII